MTGDEALKALESTLTGVAEPRRSLTLRTLADVEPEAVSWLWGGRIPRGKVTLLVGDPGSGKSFASLAISAAVTHGRPLPGDEVGAEPASVIIWNGEDGIADTIRVRAEMCDARLERVHVIESAIEADGTIASFGLNHLRILAEEVERRSDVGLIVIDPIAALLGGVDAHRDSEVRAALQPVVELATRTGVAVVVIMHLRKSDASRSLYRVGGSIGFVGLARSVLLVAKDAESGRSAIAPLKQNLAAEMLPIEFRIDGDGFSWGGEAFDLNAGRLLSAPVSDDRPNRREEAEDAIRDALADGELTAADFDAAIVQRAGIARKTFDRARAAMRERGEIERRGGGKYGPVRWASSLSHNGLLSATHKPERENEAMAERTGLGYTSALPCEFHIGRAGELCGRCGLAWVAHST
jgi:hypothetical protein